MVKARPLLAPALGLATLLVLAQDPAVAQLLGRVADTPKPMIVFIAISACVLLGLAKLQPRA